MYFKLIKSDSEILILNKEKFIRLLNSGEIDLETYLYDVDSQILRQVTEIEEFRGELKKFYPDFNFNELISKPAFKFEVPDSKNSYIYRHNKSCENDLRKSKPKIFIRCVFFAISLIGGLLISNLFFHYFPIKSEVDPTTKASFQKILYIFKSYEDLKPIVKGKFDKEKYGDNDILLSLTEEYYGNLSKVAKHLRSNVEKNKLDKVLVPKTFINNINIEKAKHNLAIIIKEERECNTKFEKLTLDFSKKASQNEVHTDFYEHYFKIYISSQKVALKQISDFFKLEEKIFVKAKYILNCMENNHDHYYILKNKIFFFHKKDREDYNKLIIEINKLGEKDKALIDKMKKEDSDTIKNVEMVISKL